MQYINKKHSDSVLNTTLVSLRTKILSGELKIGDFLPPEREMALQLGISRSTLHQAIIELEYQGFVTVLPRQGTVINDFRKFPTNESLEALMCNESLDLDFSLFRDMMDFRIWLESECAKRACEKIFPSTRNEMAEILSELHDSDADIAELMYSFHYKLTQASGNSLYSMVWRGFEPVLKAMIRHHYEIKPDDLEKSISLMQDLINYIDDKNQDKASSCVVDIVSIGISALEERYNHK